MLVWCLVLVIGLVFGFLEILGVLFLVFGFLCLVFVFGFGFSGGLVIGLVFVFL